MSQDKNDPLQLLLDELLPFFQAKINCLMLGEIVSIDKVKNGPWRADVQPAPQQSDGSNRAILGDCLILESASGLRRGDPVLVGFHDRDMDNYNGQSGFSLASRRMHSINDAIVLGGIKIGK